MKVTKSELKQIIAEEIEALLEVYDYGEDDMVDLEEAIPGVDAAKGAFAKLGGVGKALKQKLDRLPIWQRFVDLVRRRPINQKLTASLDLLGQVFSPEEFAKIGGRLKTAITAQMREVPPPGEEVPGEPTMDAPPGEGGGAPAGAEAEMLKQAKSLM